MKAILLVGGLGTRLRPLTLSEPKALLPILNRPFLSYQLDLLKEAGVKDVVLSAGKNSRAWEKSFWKIRQRGLRLHFCYEPSPLGTGGGIRYAYEFLKRNSLIDKDPLLVFNGDVFFDIDLQHFLNFHNRKGASVTIAMTRVEDPRRFGLIYMANGSRITDFVEKPKHPKGNTINAGAYLIAGPLVEALSLQAVLSIERDIFPAWRKAGEPMYGYLSSGYWNDIGTHATYLKAHQDLMSVRNRWTRESFLRKRGVLLGTMSRVNSRAKLKGTVCCGSRVRIDSGSEVQNSVIMNNVHIGKNVYISSAIIGSDCRIADNCVLNEGAVLGAGSALTPFTTC